jgi:hypothetical protein
MKSGFSGARALCMEEVEEVWRVPNWSLEMESSVLKVGTPHRLFLFDVNLKKLCLLNHTVRALLSSCAEPRYREA